MEKTTVKILEEITNSGDNESNILFKAVLQEANTVSSSGRIYPPETLRKISKQLEDKIKNKSLFGELDSIINNMNPLRYSTVLLQNIAIDFKNIEFEEDKIVATIETLNTPSGRIVRDLLKDNISIGFSLRAFGSTKNENGVTVVQSENVKGIAFDVITME